jgi:molybdate transport system ATP-binding protein
MTTRGLSVSLHQSGPIALAADFACAPGEVLALVGPSGSGKSTILRAIAGTYRPRGTAIAVDGVTWFDAARGIDVPPHKRAVGMVFQNYALFPHMTALGNLTAAMAHVPPEQREARARNLLDLVHLAGFEQRRPAELSGGQQQRVAVARALAREPKVLLLDEPFSAVDRTTRKRLYGEIAELRRVLNMPVVLVTHDLDEAMMLADRMTILDGGRTLQTGPPDEVTTRPASIEVARLVDLRNVFQGRMASGQTGSHLLIDWEGMILHTRAPRSAAAAGPLNWVIPDGFVVLQEDEAPGEEPQNPLPGQIVSILVVGQSAQIVLRPRHAPESLIHFSTPLHVARRNGIEPGADATVILLAEGIAPIPATSRSTHQHRNG